MADIASAISKMNNLEISSDAPISEATMSKIGANINGLIDAKASLEAQLALPTGTAWVATGATAFAATSGLTILSYTVTLDSNDAVEYEVAGISTVTMASVGMTVSATGIGSTDVGFYVKRGSTTVASKTHSGNNAASLTVSAARGFDKPGAGTYTYTFQVSGNQGGTYGAAGASLMFRKITI